MRDYPFYSKHFIYTLSDPRTGVIRYVGCSIHPTIRARQHRYTNTPVRAWIDELRAEGLAPLVNVVSEHRNWFVGTKQESALIAKLWPTGNLLNRPLGRPCGSQPNHHRRGGVTRGQLINNGGRGR